MGRNRERGEKVKFKRGRLGNKEERKGEEFGSG